MALVDRIRGYQRIWLQPGLSAGVVWIDLVLSVCAGVPNLPRTVSRHPYIECVFENDLVELDAAGTLAAAEANEHTLITAETRRLQIAAHWADLHPGEAVPVRVGCPAPNTRSGWAGKPPQPSGTSPPPNWAVCYGSPTDPQPG